MKKLLLAATLPLVLSACVHLSPSRCAEAQVQLDQAQQVLDQARIALPAACVIAGSEACAKAIRAVNDAQEGLDTVQRIVDAVCRPE